MISILMGMDKWLDKEIAQGGLAKWLLGAAATIALVALFAPDWVKSVILAWVVLP